MASDESSAMEDTAPVMDQEPPVLRIIPNSSLSEPAMLQLLDTIELRAQMGGMPAFFAQFVFAESDRFPSLLTQYPTMEDTNKILVFAALQEALTIQDTQVSGEKVTKQVLFQVFREEDQEAIQRALAPASTSVGRGGAPRRPSTLLIIREWGIISMTTDKEKHLAELATCTRDGFRLATPDQTIELAEPLATLMTPRVTGSGPKRITAVGVWFVGKLNPPANGLMRVGRGFFQSGVRTVDLSPHPISFAPLRGARQHSALSMPGWRYDREKECMVTRIAAGFVDLDAPGHAARDPTLPPTSPGRSSPDRGGRSSRGLGSSRSREVILQTGIERANFLLESTMGTNGERFLTQEKEFARECGVPIDQICPFAVKYKLQGKLDYTCRITKGCAHPDRGGIARFPCSIGHSRPLTETTFSIAGTVTTPLFGKGKGAPEPHPATSARAGPSGSSASSPSSEPPSVLSPTVPAPAPDPTVPAHARGSASSPMQPPALAEEMLAETNSLETVASSGAPAEAPMSNATSQAAFEARFEQTATRLETLGPLMQMERDRLEAAASEKPPAGDADSVSQVPPTAQAMSTVLTPAPYAPLSATLGDVFGHIDVALKGLRRLAPTSVLLDPEIRANLANLVSTPELRLQAATDYLSRLRAECREANNKKRPHARTPAGTSSEASRDTSPAPPAKK